MRPRTPCLAAWEGAGVSEGIGEGVGVERRGFTW